MFQSNLRANHLMFFLQTRTENKPTMFANTSSLNEVDKTVLL